MLRLFAGDISFCLHIMSMGYKKDIFGIFAYEFELLPKNLEFSNLVCGGEPPSVDQWLHHFETAYKNHRDLFLGIYRYAFEQLSYDLLIILHRSVFQSVQDGVYIVESGFGFLDRQSFDARLVIAWLGYSDAFGCYACEDVTDGFEQVAVCYLDEQSAVFVLADPPLLYLASAIISAGTRYSTA